MDAGLEADLDHVKGLLDRISWPLAALGIWPKNTTSFSHLKCNMFLTYFATHISMTLLDLVHVMGSLELVILNLMETGFQTMSMCRILIIRFDKKIVQIVNTIERDLMIENFRDPEEVKIMLEYSSIPDKFYRIGSRLLTFTAVMYYVGPLQTYLIRRMMNDTAILVYPYRLYIFIDLSPIERTSIVYACQFPMIFTAVAYVTCYSISMGFVMHFCSQLAILSRRISTTKDANSDSRIVFHEHTQQHIQILEMVQSLNDACHLALLYELIVTTVMIGLIIYQFLQHIDDADAFGVFGLSTYIASMIILVYVNCFMGECLNTECVALLNSYYECNWYEMSPFYKKALIVCMQTTQEPIRLTAGKFYVFSLENFTKVMKSSMVYVSMLRTLI